MAVNLSPLGGVAAQFFNNDGVPLSGGLIYTYLAGTNTPAATYTTGAGTIAHSNPIVLDSAGRVPTGEIWLTDSLAYKFVIKDAQNNLIGTYDNIVGINSNFVNYTASQEIQTATAGQTVFTLTTMAYQPGTNSLTVFVDGVNQYGPGAQYAFTETSSTSVTFASGLHVGASVKFTTAVINNVGGVDASQVTYDPPFVDSVATNVNNKLSEYVSIEDFGADKTGTADSSQTITNAIAAASNLTAQQGTYKLDSTVILSQNAKISGDGERVTIFQNDGTNAAFETPVSTPGGPKSYAQGLFNFRLNGTNATTPSSAALIVQQTGNTYWEKGIISNHGAGIQLEGAVGTVFKNVSIENVTNGIVTKGINNLDATTLTSFENGGITSSNKAIFVDGVTKALHFTETDIEANTNVFSGGVYNMVFRNCWFENNTNTDLDDANMPVFDTCYFSGEQDWTGGVNPVFRDVHITSSTNFASFLTNPEVSHVTATAITFNNTGQHGITLTMPTIGSASTPVDRYSAQHTAQSALIGELSGTLFGYSQPLTNLNYTNVGVTTYTPGGNYWGLGGATVTTGQPDMYGGTTAVKLEVGTNSNHGCTAIPTTSGKWYVIQMAFKMIAGGERIGLNATAHGSGLITKSNGFVVPDTNLRVMHMLFKSDDTSVNLYIQIPTSGVIVERFCMFEGAELKPMIKEGASYNKPFMMEFNNVVSYASAAPTTGTWAVGDKVYNTAPSAGGTVGWICTAAGTPGTWKTFGAIAA